MLIMVFIVDFMMIAFGDFQLPKHPLELVDFLKAQPRQHEIPDWLLDTLSMLCENAEQAYVSHQPGGR